MLADEICEKGIREYAPQLMRPVLKDIAEAQKYTLATQFAAVADKLAEDYGSLVKAFPFCRLPYPKVWIEVVHTDRPKFKMSAIQAPKFQVQPKRVGFLCMATRPDLSAWKTHLFWSITSHDLPGCNAAALALQYDMTHPLSNVTDFIETDNEIKGLRPEIFGRIDAHPGWQHSTNSVRLAMINHTNISEPDFGVPEPDGIDLDKIPEFYNIIMQLARSDWAGEAVFLLSVIGLMNARNAMETVPVNFTKLNRARVKRGNKPLFEHHVLKIHSRIQKRVTPIGGAGDHSAMRGHFVRGHWKVRKTGIFFWHPFSRGDFAKGTITKNYELSS